MTIRQAEGLARAEVAIFSVEKNTHIFAKGGGVEIKLGGWPGVDGEEGALNLGMFCVQCSCVNLGSDTIISEIIPVSRDAGQSTRRLVGLLRNAEM